MKYSEIIGVEKHFKEAFDITSDTGEAWKTFISNERFESNLSQIINCFTSPVFNNRKSIWIQGTYGTGKSHSLAVIKHLLCDDYADMEDYIPRINRGQLRNNIANFRKEKKVYPVVLKGIYTITDVADLTYTIQQQVTAALGDIDISTKSDFQAVLQILENGSLDSFFENLMKNNIELHSYAATKEQLVITLKNNDTKVIRIIADELKKAGLGGFRTHNIIEWLSEIKKELQERGIADYLLIIWDEFTSLLDIPARRSILNVMQDIAELSYSEINDNTDTLGVYLLLVTHKKLEATESYKDLKEDERNMAKARFVELDYGMQPTTTYHILSGALERKQPMVIDELIQENFLEVPSVKILVDKVIDSDSTNAAEIKEKVISLYPFHPYTSYLATFVSRVVGEAERSIFGFLNDETNGFKRFIENNIEDIKFLTADYVWDFFYKTFEQSSAGHFDAITNKFKLSREIVAAKGNTYYSVFKTILLLNILYRVTTTDADTSEKSMVNPSTENIISAFSGVLEENAVKEILDYIDENQILHRNPDGIFEVSSSALPQKKILEEKKKLYPNKEDVSKIVEEYSIKCLGKLRTKLSANILRELDVQVFWGGEKEHLLRGKLVAKFKTAYTVNVALLLYRGTTKELDEILNRTETAQSTSKDIILKLSKEDEFKNMVFVLVNTELGNKRFEAYLDSLAQEAVARSLQMEEEKMEGQKNAEKWIMQWIDEIIQSGMADIVFRGDAIYVPFGQCNKYLKNNYITTIFKYGLDTLPVSNTAWKHQTSKKAVELVFYSSNKAELEKEASGADGAIRYLLISGSTLLFDDNLELLSDDSSIPMVKVCQEVKKVFEKNKSESQINLADSLKFLKAPEYGYYQNRLFMGALALALRPYVDRLYTSGNGQRIDKTVMKDVVVAIFNYWENSKFNDKFVVRMSTEEERALTDKLNMIFGIPDQDGLLGTKWAIRDKFKKQSKAPLWALKYVGNTSDKYKEFIDKMFKFSKSTDESIQQSFIVELLEGIKTFDVELSSAVTSVQNSQCLDTYVVNELKSIDEDVLSLEEVKKYLEGQMSGDMVFWEEDDVHEQILLWKIKSKDSEAASNVHGNSGKQGGNGFGNRTSSSENDFTISENGETAFNEHIGELRESVKMKILQNKADANRLVEVLIALTDKYQSILEEINRLL
ncbi:MAG: hypothetical protein NC420_00970 [Eubacterium sp.]|nr:hypothetical protein [Eubacterium sp.]MCM1213832.1 hypothetical protein [Lachnospiraceae bacterium]MCM1237952.1 hypothetical protein [Lachnospiraceae bacterium]